MPIDSSLFSDLEKPADTLMEAWKAFHPHLLIDPDSDFYVDRSGNQDQGLQKLDFNLRHLDAYFHAFLCGHRGSGKTTELLRLCMDEDIKQRYCALYLDINRFGVDSIHLSHDALLLEVGLSLLKTYPEHFKTNYTQELSDWGLSVIKSTVKNQSLHTEAGAKGGVWLAYFKAQLASRREWKHEEKISLEPKVQDLIGILNRMAQELKNQSGKALLVVVDGLEKGDSDAHQSMHTRIFKDHYDTLIQPRFTVVYTLPVYFRALRDCRIAKDALYAFSAVRIYRKVDKKDTKPQLDRDSDGYRLMRQFVVKRLAAASNLLDDPLLDELLLIGGGLFRETAHAVHEAAYYALQNQAEKIASKHVSKVFDSIKKDYQPMIRGDAVQVLKEVMDCGEGWVTGVEPFLQSRAVVEYENGDLWLDVRYVLKAYIQTLQTDG